MKKKLGFRIALLTGAVIVSFLLILPSLSLWNSVPDSVKKFLPEGKISLGLDLKGGMSVTLEVDQDKAVSGTIDEMVTGLKEAGYEAVRSGDSIVMTVPPGPHRATVRKTVSKRYPAIVETSKNDKTVTFTLPAPEIKRIREHAMTQAVEVIRNRIDQFGVSEPMISRQGKNRILIELPGVSDPERAMALIGRTARLEFMLVDDRNPQAEAIIEKKVPVPSDDILLSGQPSAKSGGIATPYLLKKQSVWHEAQPAPRPE